MNPDSRYLVKIEELTFNVQLKKNAARVYCAYCQASKTHSIIVWRCFSAARIEDLVLIDDIMKDEYRKIIETNAILSGLSLNSLIYIHAE